jgi:rhodanese-related sulfurtransferase
VTRRAPDGADGSGERNHRHRANHLFGRPGGRAPVLGTAIVRVFDTVAATTGRSSKALTAAGIAHHSVHLHPAHHAGYYPGAKPLHLKLVFAPDGRVLGAQATGSEGVDKRIDVIATAIRAGMTIDDLDDLDDFADYAPPFGSAKDPVYMAGFAASNILAGDLAVWHGTDLDDAGAPPAGTVLLDVRSAQEFSTGHLPGALNIPHTALRERLAEVPRDVPVRVNCASGFRSYLALRMLRRNGWDDVASLSGGLTTLRLERPGRPLDQALSKWTTSTRSPLPRRQVATQRPSTTTVGRMTPPPGHTCRWCAAGTARARPYRPTR